MPAYSKVKAFIQQHISRGEWPPGHPVPSESTLMQRFAISRMTVNRALRELAAEGMVTRVQGSGTFVAELHRISSNLTIRDIKEDVIERGHLYMARVVLARREKARKQIASSLGLGSGTSVFHTILVHHENGVPIQYEDRFVNPAAAPRYLDTDFTQTTPTHHLLAEAPLTEASYAIEACLPSIEQATLLHIDVSEACLSMTRRTVSRNVVASVVTLVYPGSRYSFLGAFQA